jgi:hypothetical protein
LQRTSTSPTAFRAHMNSVQLARNVPKGTDGTCL